MNEMDEWPHRQVEWWQKWKQSCSAQWMSFQLRQKWQCNLWPSRMEMGNLHTQTDTQHARVTNQHIPINFSALECAVLPLTGVEDLLDDWGHLSLQHGVEQLDDEYQAEADHQQRESEQDQTHRQVRQIHIHKDMLTWGQTKTHASAMAGILHVLKLHVCLLYGLLQQQENIVDDYVF